MAENEGKKEKGKGGKGGGKGGKGGKGKGGEGAKAQLPKLLKSDDVTGQYKEAIIVQRGDMPEPYQQAFNNAWNVSICFCDCEYLYISTMGRVLLRNVVAAASDTFVQLLGKCLYA